MPPPPDPGSPEGTALFDGDGVITGWSPIGTTYYRSALDGTGLRIVGRDPVDAQFSPDRSRYVGIRSGLGDECLYGGVADEDATLWKECPGTLPSAPAYAPDGTRFVAYASGEGGGGTDRAVVRDASTGKQVATFEPARRHRQRHDDALRRRGGRAEHHRPGRRAGHHGLHLRPRGDVRQVRHRRGRRRAGRLALVVHPQQRPDRLPGVVDPGLHGAERTVEQPRDLVVVESPGRRAAPAARRARGGCRRGPPRPRAGPAGCRR
ncbi:hypothetical protein [Nocardioides convexus]|uniref:hypothetical protein n=1 Tax=Nocardioides convexus TaxID=2712224 RepID=UPI002418A5FE|nr:hypothetical protein [Nocardioides convexus]